MQIISYPARNEPQASYRALTNSNIMHNMEPDNFTISWRDNIATVKLDGFVTLSTIIKANGALVAYPDIENIKAILLDLTETDDFDMNEDEFKEGAAFGRANPNTFIKNKIKFAYLVSSETMEHIVEDLCLKYCHKEWERKIFYDLDKCLGWLESA